MSMNSPNIDKAPYPDIPWAAHFKHLPRFSAAIHACRAIAADGERVTRSTVKEFLGGGSDRDIAPLVQAFNSHRAILDRFESTPDQLTLLMMEAIDGVLKNLHRSNDEKIEAQTQAFADALLEQSNDIKNLEAENDNVNSALGREQEKNRELNEHCEALLTEIEHLKSDNAHQHEAVKKALFEKDQLEKKLIDRESLIALVKQQQKEEIDKINAEHEHRIKALQASSEAESSRLMKLLDNARIDHKETETTLQKSIEKLRQEHVIKTQENEKMSSANKLLETEIKKIAGEKTAEAELLHKKIKQLEKSIVEAKQQDHLSEERIAKLVALALDKNGNRT